MMLPATKKYIEAVKKAMQENPVDWKNLSIAEYRKMCEGYKSQTGPIAKVVSIQERKIPVANGAHIKAKVFDIKGEEKDTKPALIYIPGGGFIAYLDCHDSSSSIIANNSGCRVIMIEPRLAPEFKAPIPLQDTCAAVKYIFDNAENLNLDVNNIALGGDSSGANLALSAALNFRDANNKDDQEKLPADIKLLVLISGTYDLSLSVKDSKYTPFEKEDLFAPESFDYMFDNYLGQINRADPSVSPYFRDLSKLPDTTLIVAEYDGVRSQTEAIERKLKEAKVSVEKCVVEGQTHSYLILRGVMGDGKDPAKIVSDKLTEVFSAAIQLTLH